MKVLISGINGFIGSEIGLELIKEHSVLGIDQNSNNINNLCLNNNFKFIKADITEMTLLQERDRNIDMIIHCAALVHKSSTDLSWENYFRVNLEGTKNIVNSCKIKNLKKIIFFSTVEVYGKSAQNMIPDESTTPSPNSPYGVSKLAAESFIKEFCAQNRIDYTIIRPVPVYDSGFLLHINKRIFLPGKIAFYRFFDGKQLISLCSLKNIVFITNEIIQKKLLSNQIIIIKDMDDYSINRITDVIKNHLSREKTIIIKIPVIIPKFLIYITKLLSKTKGKSLENKFNKVLKNSIYSDKKIRTLKLNLKWNLENTLRNMD